jgi:hypothetical protein
MEGKTSKLLYDLNFYLNIYLPFITKVIINKKVIKKSISYFNMKHTPFMLFGFRVKFDV